MESSGGAQEDGLSTTLPQVLVNNLLRDELIAIFFSFDRVQVLIFSIWQMH